MAILSTDPIDLPLNASHDLDMLAPLTSGIAACVQGARIRLRMIAGEWFANLDAGIPYFERVGVPAAKAIFGQKLDKAKIAIEFRREILSVPGIIKIQKLDIDFNGATRAMTVRWQAQTQFGDTPLDSIALGE